MSWMACRSCSTRFAVGLLRCPQCNAVSELYAVPDYVADAEEENMPKITAAAGASNALGLADEQPVDVAPAPEVVAEPEPAMPQEETPAESPAAAPETEEGQAVAAADKPVEAADAAPEETPAPAPKKRAARKPATGTGSTTGA